MKSKVIIQPVGHGYKPGDGIAHEYDPKKYDVADTWDQEYLMEQFAEEYYRDSGWECSWPMTFIMYDEDGSEIRKFEVEVDVEPVFRVY